MRPTSSKQQQQQQAQIRINKTFGYGHLKRLRSGKKNKIFSDNPTRVDSVNCYQYKQVNVWNPLCVPKQQYPDPIDDYRDSFGLKD